MTAEQTYDSRDDTILHIHRVRVLLQFVMLKLADRASAHDASKLEEPEKSVFDEMTPRLREVEYGSDEYKACLEAMGPALHHHYAHNAGHHPEGNPLGIRGMSLLGLTEMICDWKAAGERHADGGDIRRSIEMNQDRFRYSDELKGILLNTVEELGL